MRSLIIIICRDAQVSRARDNKGYLHVSTDNKGCFIICEDMTRDA